MARASPGPVCASRQTGFTLFELALVLVISGILAAFAVQRAGASSQSASAAFQAQRLAEDLRTAQSLAMSWGTGLSFHAEGTRYRVDCPAPCPAAVPSGRSCPGGGAVLDRGRDGPLCVTLDGLALTGPAELRFDALGRPSLAGPSPLAAAAQFQLAESGSPAVFATIAVSPVTGVVSLVLTP